MNAFNFFYVNKTRIENIKIEAKNNLYNAGGSAKIGIKITNYSADIINTTFLIYSNKIQAYLFFGKFSDNFTINADKKLEMENGLDYLKFIFIDEINSIVYVCEQTIPYHTWELNKITNINFFPERIIDKKTEEPMCYEAKIISDLNACSNCSLPLKPGH
ncbi:hypothetical protein [Desulfomicrobium salsuginis]